MRRCWVNFQCRGVLLIWIIVGQGPIALAVGAGGGCLDIFSLIYHFSFLSPSLWETARYRLKYCLKGPLSQKSKLEDALALEVYPAPLHRPTTHHNGETAVGWLVGFGFNGPLRQYFSLYRAVSQREGEGERIDESKNVQTTSPAPTASAVGPCPTVVQIVGRPSTGSSPSNIAPPDHPRETAVRVTSEILEVNQLTTVCRGYFGRLV